MDDSPQQPSSLRRIAVSVFPPVFAETLVRVLARPDLELVVPAADPLPSAGYDGVLVSGTSLSDSNDAPVVIRIPDAPDRGVGSVTTADGEREVRLHTLEAVRGLIDDLWPRAGG